MLFKTGSLVKYRNSYESVQHGIGIIIESMVDPLDGMQLYDVLFGSDVRRVPVDQLEKATRQEIISNE